MLVGVLSRFSDELPLATLGSWVRASFQSRIKPLDLYIVPIRFFWGEYQSEENLLWEPRPQTTWPTESVKASDGCGYPALSIVYMVLHGFRWVFLNCESGGSRVIRDSYIHSAFRKPARVDPCSRTWQMTARSWL